MRSRTCQRTVVLLAVLLSVQGGASALADGKDPRPQPAPPGQSGTVDPLSPFAQGAATFAEMASPFVNAASDVMFPQG